MRPVLALSFVLCACNGSFAGDDKSPGLPVDTGGDSGDSAGDSGDTGGGTDSGADSGDPPLATPNWAWVIGELVVGSPSAGFDFDGDGLPDNGAAALTGFLDPIFADALAAGDKLPVVQLSGLDGWSDDDIGVALFTAIDTDLDPSDNFDGDEDLFAGAELDGEGVAVSAVDTEIVSGGYGVQLAISGMDVGDLELSSRLALKLSGYASESGHTGSIGLGLPLSWLQDLGEATGAEPRTLQAIDGSADLDLDGDGTPETVSASLSFTGVACTLR